jgi:branched-chain amino acid transport system permease protein
MPSATLLGQSLLSGVFVGGLYALMGVGLSLSWAFLRIINLAHLALVFFAAYLTYALANGLHISAFLAMALLVPVFFALAAALQWLFARFQVDEFASVLATFGMMVIVEAVIQGIWTADFRRLETPLGTASWRVGPIFVPVAEALMFAVAVALLVGIWAWLRFTYVGKAMRASAENAPVAASFGVDHARLSLLMAGVGGASAAIAGGFIALIATLAPSQIYAWVGVIFATVIMGGLGNPLGILAAGLLIGVSEALTMALTAPSWAPVVSFTLLILILILRPGRL